MRTKPDYIYRIVVEQRPNEDFKRYYPQCAVKTEEPLFIQYRDIFLPSMLEEYVKTEQEAKDTIDKHIIESADYTIDVIEYPVR